MPENSIADVLREAASIVERGWCQGWFAKDAGAGAIDPYSVFHDPADSSVAALSPHACMWCLEGALVKASGQPLSRTRINDRIARLLGWRVALAVWNDRPERTQAEVVAKLREAADLAEREAQ